MAVLIYRVRVDINYQPGEFPTLRPAAIRHLSALLAIFFLLKAGGYVLQRYGLMTNNNGVVFGAAYTDVYLPLPLLVALAVAAGVPPALSPANVWLRGPRFARGVGALVLGLASAG